MQKFKIFSLLLMTLSLSLQAKENTPKNIIFLIGDGMGPAYTSAYRYFSDDPKTSQVEQTIFDKLIVGTASTYPDDDTVVTDSAASATALATGTKTYNGAIGINRDKQPLTSILKIAKSRGYNTGVVVTSELNHATPASFIAHSESRNNKAEITEQFYTNQLNGRPLVDLLLGGGTNFFAQALTLDKQTKSITSWFKSAGYHYITSLENIDELSTLPALGLFAEKGLSPAINSKNPERLNEMTKAALRILEDENKPFFLLIEASQIDWCGHSNDIACAMAEMHDFAQTLTTVKGFVDNNKKTLMLATADHSTGGLSLGYNSVYQWKANVVKQIHGTISTLAQQLLISDEIAADWQKHVDFSLTETEVHALEAVIKDESEIKNIIRNIISDRTKTGWTTKGHDAVDVQVFASGVGSGIFSGFQDNTEINQKLKAYIMK
jgi:alkaline phosphatase